MAKKFLKGFANLGFFADVTDELDSYSTGSAQRVPIEGAVSCSVTDNRSSVNIPGDDNPAWYVESEWTDTDLEITVHGIELEDLATLLGVELSEDDTLVESLNQVASTCAINFSALRSDLGYRLYRYYCCKLMSYSVSHQTREGTTSSQDYTLRFKATARKIDGRVRETKDIAKGTALTWLNTIPAAPVA